MSTGADGQPIPQGTHSQPPQPPPSPNFLSLWCQQHSFAFNSCSIPVSLLLLISSAEEINKTKQKHSKSFTAWGIFPPVSLSKICFDLYFLKDNLTILHENNILQLLFPPQNCDFEKKKNRKSFVVDIGSCLDHRMMWCNVMTSFPCVDFWTLELHLNTKT